jgi:pyruvate kinase
MRRRRRAKIVATLGPASTSHDTIRALFQAGADVFRLNFSHGTREQHAERLAIIREVERESGRPIGVLMDLQGPKLRIGAFASGPLRLQAGSPFRLDLGSEPGDAVRVSLPHPEVFAALSPGMELLLDDGKVRLTVERCGAEFAETRVVIGGELSDRKGVNVPGVVLALSPLTAKDRADLEFGLGLGVDWLALSFVQRPEDIAEARVLVGNRAGIMAKLEKPAAIERLDAIVDASDAVMVARGDLGVELPPERVPGIQKRTLHLCRQTGKPVVVATQMLESMVRAPTPTRAEASDVATAVYDGADAVMLSAETASGDYVTEAVAMMDRIVAEVERDPQYRKVIEADQPRPSATVADAVCAALRGAATILPLAATVTYTNSGYTTLRAARERPVAPILGLTPHLATARRLALVWGVHAVQTPEIKRVGEMRDQACQNALAEGFARPGDAIVIAAGLPFGVAGTTNLLHIARIGERYE